jgi:uncharacterized protein YbjT (DUF2867 family)
VDDVAAAVAELFDGARLREHVAPVGGPTAVRFDELVTELARASGWRRHGPRIPVSLLSRSARVLPSLMGRSVHAVAMLSVDRIVPSPQQVGFDYVPTLLSTGIEAAVHRYTAG